MKSILEILLYNYVKENKRGESVNILEAETERNMKRLKENFNRKQKKLLLRIVDSKDLIIEESNLESFAAGFKIGLSLGYESNKD